jgi:leucyl/phenylalanyl-tRNA--protein transferase
MRRPHLPIPWLNAGDPFPALEQAWGQHAPAPGLLAAGGALDVATLSLAYSQGIFPWFSVGQPVLWWSPDPRMVLNTDKFKLHRSLLKTLRRFAHTPGCEVSMDRAFAQVIRQCAGKLRVDQNGTWIVPEMIAAYEALHRAGLAHSVETWMDGELVGGLYCVNLGGMVFGESMFAHRTDASKIALAALVAFCRAHAMDRIDCQQNTGHLATLGAAEIARAEFVAMVAQRVDLHAPNWQFSPLYWQELFLLAPP